MPGFFSRKSRRHAPQTRPGSRTKGTARPDKQAWGSVVNNSIAKIDRIGATAVATLTVTELSTYEGVAMLSELFSDVTHSGASSFVLDIQNLEFLDSVCLGCLVKALNHAVSDGGRIAVVNTDGNVQDLLRIACLDRLFPICHDVPSALAAIERT